MYIIYTQNRTQRVDPESFRTDKLPIIKLPIFNLQSSIFIFPGAESGYRRGYPKIDPRGYGYAGKEIRQLGSHLAYGYFVAGLKSSRYRILVNSNSSKFSKSDKTDKTTVTNLSESIYE